MKNGARKVKFLFWGELYENMIFQVIGIFCVMQTENVIIQLR